MNREGHNNVKFFIGPEVEHTPAYSKRTLFVVDKQPVESILDNARKHKVTHVFMGANHSFDASDSDTYWDKTITELLDRGLWVSLDYQAHEHDKVLKLLNPGIWQSRIFVPLLNVRVAHVQTSSPNLTIKIDDVDFKATNAGVWCLNHHEITDSNRFTDWADYGSDTVIYDEVPPVVTAVPPVIPKTVLTTAVEETVTESVVDEVKNEVETGLDTESKSQLKADVVEEIAPRPQLTPGEAIEAYTEGAGEKEVKKAAKAKK